MATIAIEPLPDEGPVFPTPEERLLALLTEDHPNIEGVAMSLASVGGAPARRKAGDRLVELARSIGTDAWRAREEARIAEEADEGAAARELGMEAREARAIGTLLAAMSHIGGPAIIDYCFAIGADPAAPWERRAMALRVLDRVLGPDDTERRDRRAALAGALPVPHTISGGSEGMAIVASHMRPMLQRCYRRSLDRDGPFQGKGVVTLHVGPGGDSWATLSGDTLPPALARCIENAAKGMIFTGAGPRGAAFGVSFTFHAQ